MNLLSLKPILEISMLDPVRVDDIEIRPHIVLHELCSEEQIRAAKEQRLAHQIAFFASSAVYTSLIKVFGLLDLSRKYYLTHTPARWMEANLKIGYETLFCLARFAAKLPETIQSWKSKYFTQASVTLEPWKRTEITFAYTLNGKDTLRMEVPLHSSKEDINKVNEAFYRFCDLWMTLRTSK